MIPLTNKSFVAELKDEIGEAHFLHNECIHTVAKCDSNDDMLYLAGSEEGRDTYYIFHLTYTSQNAIGFPKYQKFMSLIEVKKFIEQRFIEEYL